MNRCVVDIKTNELIAYISDTHTNIVKNGYEIIEYGCTEPIFTTVGDLTYVKPNAFEINT